MGKCKRCCILLPGRGRQCEGECLPEACQGTMLPSFLVEARPTQRGYHSQKRQGVNQRRVGTWFAKASQLRLQPAGLMLSLV